MFPAEFFEIPLSWAFLLLLDNLPEGNSALNPRYSTPQTSNKALISLRVIASKNLKSEEGNRNYDPFSKRWDL